MPYVSERFEKPHHPDPCEKVEPQTPSFWGHDGWWIGPVVILAVSIIPILMVIFGRGEPLVDLLVLLFQLVWLLLIPGSVAGMITGAIKKKPRWVRNWFIMLLIAVLMTALLFVLG